MGWFWNRSKPEKGEERVVTVQDVWGDSPPGEILDLVSSARDAGAFTMTKATGIPAVWAAVNFISDTMAALPLQVFEKSAEDRTPLRDEAIYRILHDAPNIEWTSYAWRKYVFWQLLTEGRSVSYIQRAANNTVVNIWPMEMNRTKVAKEGLTRTYEYTETTGKKRIYQSFEVLDLTFALDDDQVTHLSPLRHNKEAIKLMLGMQSYAQKHFANGGLPPAALQGPFQSPQGVAKASEQVWAAIKKLAREGKSVLPMPLGHELKALGVSPEDGQLLEGRLFGVQDVARIYSLPPIFLQDLSNGTYANAEQQDLQLVKHTITQWVKQFEQELDNKLFRNGRRFAQFNVDGLLRGDFKTRMEGYAKGIQNSVMQPNEARKKENMPAVEGGDVLVLQQNMQSVKSLGDVNADGNQNSSNE